jgi:hypothetical protein
MAILRNKNKIAYRDLDYEQKNNEAKFEGVYEYY